MAIKVLIVDDHKIVHLGLSKLFEGTDIEIAGEAFHGKDAFKLAKKLRPNLILLDVRMPDGDGLTCLARIKSELPDVPVIMFSGFDNPTYVARSVAIGAAGYLTKDVAGADIINAIRAAAGGENIWSRDSLRRVVEALTPSNAGAVGDVALTKRESEVLTQIALGLSNKEIGQALHISYETVKEHVQHILRKIGVTDRTQAAVWAVRKNLV